MTACNSGKWNLALRLHKSEYPRAKLYIHRGYKLKWEHDFACDMCVNYCINKIALGELDDVCVISLHYKTSDIRLSLTGDTPTHPDTPGLLEFFANYAFENNYYYTLKLLLSRIAGNVNFLKKEIMSGRTEIFKLLYKPCNFPYVILAAKNDRRDIIKFLVEQGANPGVKNSMALVVAAERGKYKTVEMLLDMPQINPGCRNNISLQKALKNRHYDVAILLSRDPRVRDKENYEYIMEYTF